MNENRAHVEAFYSRHPISVAQILHRVAAQRGGTEGLAPEELFPYDQDHYGGLAAVDALAARAGIRAGTRVVDLCAGLGGPARYLAHRYGALVTCVELNPDRSAGLHELTARVGLSGQVRVVRGNVMALPLASRSMEAAVSQEALLHVPDKGAVMREAFRVLVPGGRIAFTDWIEHHPLEAEDLELMWRGMAAQTLQSGAGYSQLLEQAGFRNVSWEDLTHDWGVILEKRFAMYRKLGRDARAAGNPAGDDGFYESYERLVQLVQARVLGGFRFVATRP